MDDDFEFSEDDKHVWESVSESIKPLHKEKKPSKKAKKSKIKIETQIIPPSNPIPALDLEIKEIKPISVNSSVDRKLREGKYDIDATIDLHGKTEGEAYQFLQYFLRTSYEMNKKCILVITGKGKEGEGILKNSVPKWLNLPGFIEYVITFCQAKPKHGGSGALYVLIKNKNKSAKA